MVRADASPYFDAESRSGLVVYALAVHLVFAITTFGALVDGHLAGFVELSQAAGS